MYVNEDELEMGTRGVEDNWYQGKPFTGTSFRLDEQGNKVAETSYDDGMVHGVEREFYSTGELKSEITFHLAQEHGPIRFYDLHGQLIKEQMFIRHLMVRERIFSGGQVQSEWRINRESSRYLAVTQGKLKDLFPVTEEMLGNE